MSTRITTVLVVLHDDGRALIRLLALCHRRGWTPASLRSVSDGDRCEVTMRLRVPADRRGTDGQVRTQLGRLVGVERVAIDRGPARRQRFPASTVLRATQPDARGDSRASPKAIHASGATGATTRLRCTALRMLRATLSGP
jgi:hypothetical protein